MNEATDIGAQSKEAARAARSIKPLDELGTMSKCLKLIQARPPEEQHRIASWLFDKVDAQNTMRASGVRRMSAELGLGDHD